MTAHAAPKVAPDPADAMMTDEAVELTAAGILGVLDNPIIVLDARLTIRFANMAAEMFLGRAVGQLLNRPLSRVLPNSDHWLPVLELARDGGMKTSERGIAIRFPHEGADHIVDFNASPIGDDTNRLVVSLHETTVSHQVDRRMGFLGAAQSVTGMAAVLAHEIKNPLSGIRGASQLLEGAIGDNDRPLTALIRSEVDRIYGLVDRMTIPMQDMSVPETPVNIHEVLDRVQQLAQTGFGSHIHFVTHYDPSLPDVKGDHDLLIQAFLNLIKNAVEACPPKKGRIRLATAYRSGIGMTSPQDGAHHKLGVEVTITDNGSGIDPAVRSRLFEPFITSKKNGSGLGLALTAKIISDLGGMIDCESLVESGGTGTMFRTLLPIYGTARRRVP